MLDIHGFKHFWSYVSFVRGDLAKKYLSTVRTTHAAFRYFIIVKLQTLQIHPGFRSLTVIMIRL